MPRPPSQEPGATVPPPFTPSLTHSFNNITPGLTQDHFNIIKTTPFYRRRTPTARGKWPKVPQILSVRGRI